MDSSILYVENTKCSHFSFNNFCTIVANLCWPACTRLILLLLGVSKLYKQFFSPWFILRLLFYLRANKWILDCRVPNTTMTNSGTSIILIDSLFGVEEPNQCPVLNLLTSMQCCCYIWTCCLPSVEGHPQWMLPALPWWTLLEINGQMDSCLPTDKMKK